MYEVFSRNQTFCDKWKKSGTDNAYLRIRLANTFTLAIISSKGLITDNGECPFRR